MTGDAGPHETPSTLTEAQARRMLAEMNEVIRAGEEMRKLRAEVIGLLVGFGWTQDTIARLTEMSQPAVSKQVAKYRHGDPLPTTGLALGQQDTPWLEGRLWALAEEIAETVDAAHCTRHVAALARGRTRFTPRTTDELRRLVEADLLRHRSGLPPAYRRAYDEISRGLDLPSQTAAAPTAPASVRRALAHRLQRDRFRSDAPEPER
ncbi:MAG TPA: hypothetical protein DD420_38020 [Streptomyces sp.]|nr:hypothetical protein [Streptomyces sp.]